MAEAFATVAIVSSIVQLTDFTCRVLARLNEFQPGIQETPRTFRQIRAQIPLLLHVLNKTKEAIDAGRIKQESAEALLPTIKRCQEEIESFNAILVKILPAEGDSRTRRSLKAVSSAFSKDGKIDKIRSSIQHHVQILTMYYSYDSKPMTDETLIEIRCWLSAPDPSLNYQKAFKQYLRNTGLWFLESELYANWKVNAASFLWLHGIPGCGKTILSSTIIQDLLRDCHDNQLVGYYYFAFNDSQKQTSELMVKSLITQLSRHCSLVPAALESLFTSCENGNRQPSLDALLDVLHRIIQDFSGSFIVLDGLDECNDLSELLDILQTIASWQIENLHFIVTSRDEPDIRDSVEDLCKDGTVCLQSRLVDKDIYSYVDHRLSNDKNFQRWKKYPEVQRDIKAVLTEKACGM